MDYEHLWITTSLRGVLSKKINHFIIYLVGTLQVNVLTEGVHSGDASGVVSDSFRVVR